MKVGSRHKAPDFDRVRELSIFTVNHMDIAIGEREKIDQFEGDSQTSHGFSHGKDRHGCHQRDQGNDNDIGFDRNHGRIEDALSGSFKRADGENGMPMEGEREEKPQEKKQDAKK